jgi:ubiquinone/menaquinone biosynthesis C-methylase UbiE
MPRHTGHEHRGFVLHSGRLYDLLARFIRKTDAPILDLAELRSGDALLDVGTGPGYLARAAAPRVGESGRAVGLDASPEMIAQARKRATQEASSAEFVEAEAQTMPFADGEFGVVVSRLAMHHLPGEAREQALAEMSRVLRPGGRLVLVDMLAPSPLRLLHDMVRGSPSGSLGGEGGLFAAVRRAGFTDATTGPVGWLSYVKAKKPES